MIGKLALFFFLISLLINDAFAIKPINKAEEAKLELEHAKKERSVRAPCPNSCSGHGTCDFSTGKCNCQTYYGGEDCSIQIFPLTSGVPRLNQTLGQKEWIYYTITTTNGQGLIVYINQTGLFMDVDLFLLRDALPSRTNYEVKDEGMSQNFTAVVDNAKNGVWYIGAYGYTQTSFSILAVVTGTQCPSYNNCNPPHGLCTGQDQCTCYGTYLLPDCGKSATILQTGVPVLSIVGSHMWDYYVIDTLPQFNTLLIQINQTTDFYDLDLYVRFNNTPTSSFWDYRDITPLKDFSLMIDQTKLGRYWIGIYGFTAGQYTIRASLGIQCPNQCSKHGTCNSDSTCTCSPNFQGAECETMTSPLQVQQSVSGYVGHNSWNYYNFQTSTTQTLSVSIIETDNTGDCDLYVRSGSMPTLTQFDYFNNGITRSYTIDISDPGDAVWYFGVFGYTTCDYSIMVNITTNCPGNPPCSGHGNCVNSICNCSNGYSGDDCSSTFVLMKNAAVLNGTVSMNYWKYFGIDINSTTFLAVDVKELTTVGSVWVFVSKEIQPDIRNYDYADQDTNSPLHSIDVTLPSPQSNRWIIGVYGNPFAQNTTIPFKITAWYPPF